MSNTRKKGAEQNAWLDHNLHVWLTKGGELTVVNLRNCSETLKPEPERPPAEAAVPVPRSAVPLPASQGKTNGAAASGAAPAAREKVDLPVPASVSAKAKTPVAGNSTTQRPSAEAEPTAVGLSVKGGTADAPLSIRIGAALPNIRVKTVPATGGLTSSHASAPLDGDQQRPSPASATSAQQQQRSSAVAGDAGGETRETRGWGTQQAPASGTAGEVSSALGARRAEERVTTAFEFVAGTNIPGRGVVGAEEKNESAGFALFHDPVWGNGSSTWGPSLSSKKPTSTPSATAEPKPLLDLFGTAKKNDGHGAVSDKTLAPTPPAPQASTPPSVQALPQGLMSSLPAQLPMFPGGVAGLGQPSFLAQPNTAMGTLPAAGYLGGIPVAHPQLAGYSMMGLPTTYLPQPGAVFPTASAMPYGGNTFFPLSGLSGPTASLATMPGQAAMKTPTVLGPSVALATSRDQTSSTPPASILSGTNVAAKPFVPSSA